MAPCITHPSQAPVGLLTGLRWVPVPVSPGTHTHALAWSSREKFPSGMAKRCRSRSGFLCRESHADDLEYKMEEGNAWWLLGTAEQGGNVPPARAAGSRRARDAAGVGPEAARGVGGQQRPGVAAHGHLVGPLPGWPLGAMPGL